MPRPAPGLARAAAIAGLAATPLIGYTAAHAGPQALLLALITTLFALCLRWPLLAVHALVAGTFFDEIHLPTGFALLGLADLAALLLIPTWLTHRLLRPHDLRLPTAWPLLLAYLALAFTSLLLGVAPTGAYGSYARLLTYALALLALVDLVRDPAHLRTIATLMALCGLAHALISLTDPAPARRLMGLADQPNILAVRLALGALPAAALWTQARTTTTRWSWGIALTLMLTATALTISRGTYLALTIAFIWWIRRSPRLALALALAATTSYLVLDHLASDRITHIQNRLDFDDTSVTHRGIVAQNALTAIAQRPLLGVGFGQFRELDQAITVLDQAGRGSHNFYLGVAASTGLPALALLLAFALTQARGLALRRLPSTLPSPLPTPPEAMTHLLALWQAIALYHATSLLIRGGLRLTDWTLLGLYAALACIHRQHRDP